MCGQQHVSPPFIHSKSRMRKRARTDLRGGRSAMVVPTATVILAPICLAVSCPLLTSQETGQLAIFRRPNLNVRPLLTAREFDPLGFRKTLPPYLYGRSR